MTEPNLQAARSSRQAAALFIHYARRDAAGCNAVIDEIKDGEQARDLVLALLGIVKTWMPLLLTPTGLALLTDVLIDLAQLENGDPS